MDETNQPNKPLGYLMTIGHICCDMNQAAVPALLPFLVATRNIDYTAAAGLMFASHFLSSLIQPPLGIIADRRQMHWLMGVGILLAGIGIAAVGFLDNYWSIFVAVMLAGAGAALFHPEGGRMANYVSGEKKGRGMSNFSVGGSLGFIIGPVVTALAVTTWGVRGIAVLMVPTLIVSAVFFLVQNRFVQLSGMIKRKASENAAIYGQRDDWPAFFKFCISIFARSIVYGGMQTFIPLYWISVLLRTEQQGSLMVTVMAVASTIGTFFGGRLADLFGFRRIVRIALATVFPLIILMLLARNVWIATTFVMLASAMSSLAQSPSVVLGQKYLPNRLGLASGVSMGLAFCMGGIFSPVLGRIGDSYGLSAALYVVAGIALVAFLGSLLLTEPKSASN